MTFKHFTIRTASIDDTSALLEIYRPYIETTVVSFELDVPSLEEFSARIQNAVNQWSWLVAEVDHEIVGYAYGSMYRARAAYAYSVEISAYVKTTHHRSGIARALYTQLFAELKTRGFVSAYAGIALPNEPSISFHRGFGFQPIGVFPKVGYKFDQWHDVAWLYRPIGDS